MHKVFGIKEEVKYTDREGAYLIPIRNNSIGVVRTSKGYFLLGGGLDGNESHEECIKRECMEEVGCVVSIKHKIGSAETYCKHSIIGYFHPIQTYYVGEVLDKTDVPIEEEHKLVWVEFNELKGKMYLEMQNWALEKSWDNK